MNSNVVSGLSHSQISRYRAAGRIVKIARGLYCWEEPTPEELVRIIMKRWPGAILTGESAMNYMLRQPLHFPLQLVSGTTMPKSEYFTAIRSRCLTAVRHKGVAYHVPALAIEHLEDEQALEFLELLYKGRDGRQRLAQDLALIPQLPGRSRRLVELASAGSDSISERLLVKKLRSLGVKVLTNYKIGPYYFDLYLPELGVVVEINGFEFHATRESFIKDHWKNNFATLQGYTVLNYTGSCIKHHLNEVAMQILSVKNPSSEPESPVWTWHTILRRAS